MSPEIGDLLKVTRDDMQDFPGDTVKLIMQMQKDGWRAQRSNRNHIMLLAPDGETRLSASRNASSFKYISEELRKYDKSKGNPKEIEKVPATTKYSCPRDDCMRSFNSLKNLDVHINVYHEGRIKCPECDETFEKPHVMGIHRAQKHNYVSPSKARRLELKALREAKRLEEEQAQIKEVMEPELTDPQLDAQNALKAGVDAEYSERVLGFLDPQEVFELQDIQDPEEYNNRRDEIVQEWTAKNLTSEKVEPEKDLEFIDTRHSWTLDLTDIADFSVETVMKNMVAAGLNMEIRVWKVKK